LIYKGFIPAGILLQSCGTSSKAALFSGSLK
jgi:hypothetical protein